MFTVHTVKSCKVQGVPHHIGSYIPLTCDFWENQKIKKNESFIKILKD